MKSDMKNFLSYIEKDRYGVGCTGQTIFVYDKSGNKLAKFKDLPYVCYMRNNTFIHKKLNIFRTKDCCPYYNSLEECVQIGTTFFIYFPVLPRYDALAMGICAAFSIFSINIPYPVVGSLMRTWVTAPTSLPFWMMGLPDIP